MSEVYYCLHCGRARKEDERYACYLIASSFTRCERTCGSSS